MYILSYHKYDLCKAAVYSLAQSLEQQKTIPGSMLNESKAPLQEGESPATCIARFQTHGLASLLDCFD